MMINKIPINLDFDGTCVVHKFPAVGEENPHCVEVLKKWVSKYNVGLILHTMRDNSTIKPALKWFRDKGIPLWSVGTNPTQKEWTQSVKSYGFYVDDMCVGIPIRDDGTGTGRTMVDWFEIDRIMEPTLKRLNNID